MQAGVSFLRDTKRTGDVSELRVMAALAGEGYRILIPFGENCRYDVAIERGGEFARVQIKSGRLRDGVILFNAYSSHYHRGARTRGYEGDVEFFGVYCAELDEVYLIPAGTIRLSGSLRVRKTRNGQAKHVRWAEAYRIARGAEGMIGSFSNHAPRLESPS